MADDLVERARAQHGLITRSQALDLGLTDRRIATRISSGAWERVRAGVYLVGAAPRTWEQRVHAATLAAGPDALASYRTAARAWGLVDRSGRIELTVPRPRRVRLPDITVHQSSFLGPTDVAVVGGLPVTSLPRTITDLAGRHPLATVERWIDRSMRDHELDLTEVAACCTRLTHPGIPAPTTAMEAVARRSDSHDPGRSALESRAIAALALAGLPRPELQWRVRRPDGSSAYIDLAYPGRWVAIELDGWAEHGLRSAFDPDRVRANDLVLLGWTVLRFTWTMSDRYLCQTVAAAIGAPYRQV
ncbi:MAG: type IV toxin-antitoxin system AbiEi family antitoxin domain-containing protein [Acidimicrobiales bacterium]|nr:type IV toxin-antitoxin system AbiEi family antitoxin domain-containing protein [Acidimicrobiales bacterium]